MGLGYSLAGLHSQSTLQNLGRPPPLSRPQPSPVEGEVPAISQRVCPLLLVDSPPGFKGPFWAAPLQCRSPGVLGSSGGNRLGMLGSLASRGSLGSLTPHPCQEPPGPPLPCAVKLSSSPGAAGLSLSSKAFLGLAGSSIGAWMGHSKKADPSSPPPGPSGGDSQHGNPPDAQPPASQTCSEKDEK